MLSEHGGHVDRLVLRTQTNSSAGELTQIERRLHMASLDGSKRHVDRSHAGTTVPIAMCVVLHTGDGDFGPTPWRSSLRPCGEQARRQERTTTEHQGAQRDHQGPRT